MRPSEFYPKIEAALAGNPALSPVPRVANTYQEKLINDDVLNHLKEPGLAICYYFHRTTESKAPRRGMIQAEGMFTLVVVENVTQHRDWIAANSTVTDFRSKSALEIAEEITITLYESEELCQCGRDHSVRFAKPMIERVSLEGGTVVFEVNLLVDLTIKS